MSKIIQSVQQERGKQVPQKDHKKIQDGKSLKVRDMSKVK